MQIDASIKNIVFDFGGVILNIDYTVTEQAFAKLGLKNFATIYSQTTQKELFDVFEKGLISSVNFRKEIKKFINGNTSDEQIDEAWKSMLLDLPEERVHLLDNLKKKYRLFLLSNTNEIHFTSFTAYMQKKFNRKIFTEVFDKYYVSHKINMRKPDAEIFELVLSENKLIREETLFIDDSFQHIEGANKFVGLKTYFLKKRRNYPIRV